MNGDFDFNALVNPRQRTYTQQQASPSEGLVAGPGALQPSDMAEVLEAVAAQLRARAGIDRPINVRVRINIVRLFDGTDPRLFDRRGCPRARGGADWPAFNGDEIVQ